MKKLLAMLIAGAFVASAFAADASAPAMIKSNDMMVKSQPAKKAHKHHHTHKHHSKKMMASGVASN